jgi:hypothetical protein
MAQPLKGGRPTTDGQQQPRPQPQLTEPTIIPNEPSSTVAGALANSKRQVEAAK